MFFHRIFPLLACWLCMPVLIASADPVVIRISTTTPLEASNNQTLRHFKDNVEAKSAGELRVEIYDSGKLYSDANVIGAVKDGTIEMGFIVLTRYAEKVPALDLFQLPFLFNKSEVAAAAAARGCEIRQLVDSAILTRENGRVLWWALLGHSVLIAERSLADPANLVGKRVRSYGPMMASLITHCGGEPMDVSGPDQEKAYQTKGVDIGMTPITIYIDRKLWRVMNTVTRTNHAVVVQLAVMNETFYQNLSERHKTIIQSASEAADQEAAMNALETDRTAYQRLVDGRLAHVVPLTSDEVQHWRFCSSDVLTDYVAQAGELGQKLIAAYGGLRKQPCCDNPD
jgi:C4-dicarboxylate-binding protein DctP